MQLVVITPEHLLNNEASVINRLFSEGMEILHLRKPKATVHELRQWLDNINKDYHKRIVLHDHFTLASQYRLKGVHLNSRNPVAPEDNQLAVSKSCHRLNELNVLNGFEYVFLSPVFDSISKSGYGKAFTEQELTHARNEGLICAKVYALGGISLKEIPLAASYGFGGVVVLGALWGDFERSRDEAALISRFAELKQGCQRV